MIIICILFSTIFFSCSKNIEKTEEAILHTSVDCNEIENDNIVIYKNDIIGYEVSIKRDLAITDDDRNRVRLLSNGGIKEEINLGKWGPPNSGWGEYFVLLKNKKVIYFVMGEGDNAVGGVWEIVNGYLLTKYNYYDSSNIEYYRYTENGESLIFPVALEDSNKKRFYNHNIRIADNSLLEYNGTKFRVNYSEGLPSSNRCYMVPDLDSPRYVYEDTKNDFLLSELKYYIYGFLEEDPNWKLVAFFYPIYDSLFVEGIEISSSTDAYLGWINQK